MFWQKPEGAQGSAGWPAWAVMLATAIGLFTGVALGTTLGYGGFAAALALMAVFSAAMVSVRREE
ncbi:MAG: hypothetical protein OXM56_08295 [Gammaproteobacteria bacterium]|nr:hypothetical protein [Gammaproteobacteria bacterium]